MPFTDPQTNLRQFGLRPTDHVADFGAGTGAYSIPASRMAGEGKVYAIEVQKDLLERIKSDATKAHISNIEFIWGDIESSGGTKLKEGAVDSAIVSNVLFQVPDRNGLVGEVKRILKPGGRVLLIDWKDSFGGMGPNSTQLVSKALAQSFFEQAGFQLEKEIDAGEHHYGLVFRK